MYNLTNVTDSVDFLGFMSAINDLGDGLFTLFFLLIIFITVFVMTRQLDNISGLLYAGYITSVFGILFFWIGFIDIMILMIPIVLTGVLLLVKINANQ